MSGFTVDLDRLDDIVEQIARFDSRLEAALEDADARVTRLHATWSGSAAALHRRAHDEWRHAATEMRAALTVMRQIASTARTNYGNATAASLAMWEQLR